MAKKENTELVVFKLIDRNPVFASTHEGDSSRKLDFALWHEIKNPSFIETKGGVRRAIRYIKGANTIFVDEQNKQGLVFNPLLDILGFDSGNDLIIDAAIDKCAVDYLRATVANASSTNHDPKRHKHLATFEEYKPEKERNAQLSRIDIEDKAMDMIRSLRDNESDIRRIAPIFNIGSLFRDPSEIWLQLRDKAMQDPEFFVSSVLDRKKSYQANVTKAFEFGIISIDKKDGAKFIENNAVISSKTKTEEELANFFMEEGGQTLYNHLLVKIKQKEVEFVNPI